MKNLATFSAKEVISAVAKERERKISLQDGSVNRDEEKST